MRDQFPSASQSAKHTLTPVFPDPCFGFLFIFPLFSVATLLVAYYATCAVQRVSTFKGNIMEYALLRSLRALGPGLMWLSYADLFLILALREEAFFWRLDVGKLLLVGYIIGGAYGLVASAFKKDAYAFSGTNEHVRDRLGMHFPAVQGRTWDEVSPCWYHIIDTDASLQKKGQGIYYNGLLVTSAFNAIWISVVAVLAGIAAAVCDLGCRFLLVATAAVLVSAALWRLALRRHRQLVDAQVNVVQRRFAPQFQACMASALNPRGAEQ